MLFLLSCTINRVPITIQTIIYSSRICWYVTFIYVYIASKKSNISIIFSTIIRVCCSIGKICIKTSCPIAWCSLILLLTLVLVLLLLVLVLLTLVLVLLTLVLVLLTLVLVLLTLILVLLLLVLVLLTLILISNNYLLLLSIGFLFLVLVFTITIHTTCNNWRTYSY